MKSFLIAILCAASLISAAPDAPQGTPAHIVATMNKSLTGEKTKITVINGIDEIGCLLDLPDESIEKINAKLPSVVTKVNGQVIKLGETKEMMAGSMVLVSVELPAKACAELVKKLDIFKRIAFSVLNRAVHLKILFLVPVEPENPEINLLMHLVGQLEKWETQLPKVHVTFKSPFIFVITLS